MDVSNKVFVGRGTGHLGWDRGAGCYAYLAYLPASAGDGSRGGWRIMRPRVAGLKESAGAVMTAVRCRQMLETGRYTAVGAIRVSVPMPAPGETLPPGALAAMGVCWLVTLPELDDAHGVCEAVKGWDSLYAQFCSLWRHTVLDPFTPTVPDATFSPEAFRAAGLPVPGHTPGAPAQPRPDIPPVPPGYGLDGVRPGTGAGVGVTPDLVGHVHSGQ